MPILTEQLWLEMDPEVCPYDTVCFHAQQLAEKYIKGLLVHLNIDFHKTHDLKRLTDLLPRAKRDSLPLNSNELDDLSDHAFAGRYPGMPEALGAKEAREAIGLARRMRDWVRTQLPQAALP